MDLRLRTSRAFWSLSTETKHTKKSHYVRTAPPFACSKWPAYEGHSAFQREREVGCAPWVDIFTVNKLSFILCISFLTPIIRNGTRNSSTLSVLAMLQSWWAPSFWNVALSALHVSALGADGRGSDQRALGCSSALSGSGILRESVPTLLAWGTHRAHLHSGHYPPSCDRGIHSSRFRVQQKRQPTRYGHWTTFFPKQAVTLSCGLFLVVEK